MCPTVKPQLQVEDSLSVLSVEKDYFPLTHHGSLVTGNLHLFPVPEGRQNQQALLFPVSRSPC